MKERLEMRGQERGGGFHRGGTRVGSSSCDKLAPLSFSPPKVGHALEAGIEQSVSGSGGY